MVPREGADVISGLGAIKYADIAVREWKAECVNGREEV